MAEEIKGQAVQVEEAAGAETGEAVAPQDYNSLYHQEVKNSKKQRASKQALQSELDLLNAKISEADEADKLARGKHEEVIKQLKDENKLLKADSETLSALKASEREALKAKFTDEEWEKVSSLDNNALKVVVDRTEAQSKEIEHPKSTAAIGRLEMSSKPYNEMSEAERQQHHEQALLRANI